MSQRTAAALASLLVAVAGPLLAPAAPGSAATTGRWTLSCGYVGSAPDDPIVLPGQPGASHQHDFFGNRSVRAASTYASMRGMASSCPELDRASYWTPALYRDGRKVKPIGMTASYSAPVSTGRERIEPFPPDFKMVTGNARNTDPAAVGGNIGWGCVGGAIGPTMPGSCASGGIQLRITFPSCWNGRDRSGDASDDLRFSSRGTCPAGFERALPTLRIAVAYPTGVDVGAITLASGPISTIHADFWNTWNQARLTRLVQTCLQAGKQCPHFTGVTPGALPGTLLGAGPPLQPTRIPDPGPPAGDDPSGGGPATGDPAGGDQAGDDVARPAPGEPAPQGPPAPGAAAQDPPAGVRPGAGARGAAGPSDAGPAAGAARPEAQRVPADTPTAGAPPWTRRRTQVLDEQDSAGRPASGKQQTWTFAAEQEPPPAWVGLAGAGVALMCLIAGGLRLARHRRSAPTGSR